MEASPAELPPKLLGWSQAGGGSQGKMKGTFRRMRESGAFQRKQKISTTDSFCYLLQILTLKLPSVF